MQGKRTERLNSLIQNELGQLVSTRLRDSRLGFVTITQVEISPDLKYCKVFVSVIGSEKEAVASLAALKHAEGFLKKALSDTLKLRFTPKLEFVHDERVEKGMRLDQIFKQIETEESLKPREEGSGPAEESPSGQ